MKFVTIILITVGMCFANDSTARVGIGGIQFLKNNQIHMEDEYLKISSEKINVTYTYANSGQLDVFATIAFPMPLYNWEYFMTDSNPRPVETFIAHSNGKLIHTSTNKRAIINGIDITNKLRDAGLTETQIFTVNEEPIIEGLNKKQETRLKAVKELKQPYAIWKISETAYWKQKFPANNKIIIDHEYVPQSGIIYSYTSSKQFGPTIQLLPTMEKNSNAESCIDKAIRTEVYKRADNLIKNGSTGITVTIRDVEYILGTGRNWRGPIGSFDLEIIKNDKDNIVSSCFPYLNSIDNTPEIKVNLKNFTPPDNLIVYFISVTGSNQ